MFQNYKIKSTTKTFLRLKQNLNCKGPVFFFFSCLIDVKFLLISLGPVSGLCGAA